MINGEKGFVLLEIIIATSLAAIVMSISIMTIVYVLKNNQQTSDHMAAVFYADNTGYLISNDVQMADSITTENLIPPELMVISWTEWGYDEDSIYHVVTYSIEDISGEIGKLKRVHQDSNGSYEEMIIADCIYSNEVDPENTTQVNYQDPVLNMKITTVFGDTTGVKEYDISCRPNFQ